MAIAFALKKILGSLLLPLALSLELMLVGVLLLWFTRRQRLGKVLVSFGLLTLAVLSYDAAANSLIARLERLYPVLDPTTLAARAPDNTAPNAPDAIRWVVVLGGGHVPDPHIPPLSQLTDDSRTRLIEGVLCHRALPGSRLLLSGGATAGAVPEAETMAKVARILGVDDRDMVLEAGSRDTEDQAIIVQEMVGRDAFLLVTSASHMPRAMALFEKRGMRPTPAPTGYEARQVDNLAPQDFFPHARSLFKAERAVYELLGLAWAHLKGSI